ncbi:hypothetical protein AMAG_04005 [Allomyces macrogynus ATCC 38327]|uniref:Fungal lipase-type domain-containing protein n=1 Tax=Allomyces macrogynus (strain ATCC 38327) TaxID=578462 RepID=A0A0L0S7N3_ALLM3|nr:hypothetical protein AMAG_04005 [Allomyces macrogynus ATCC 38327]|eukprot:KNE58435.1 hypothetical protein AMAG_04005 [Allomyces macrogynus ATCC 38327]
MIQSAPAPTSTTSAERDRPMPLNTLPPALPAIRAIRPTRRIGPHSATKLHKAQSWTRSLHAVATLALAGGVSMILALMLCVQLALAYILYSVNVTDLTAPVAAGIVFYAVVVWRCTATLLRTAVRIGMWIWSPLDDVHAHDMEAADAKSAAPAPAEDEDEDSESTSALPITLIVLAPGQLLAKLRAWLIFRISTWLVHRQWRKTMVGATGPPSGELDVPESPLSNAPRDDDDLHWQIELERHRMAHRVQHVLDAIVIVLVFVVPSVVISAVFGFYGILSFLTAFYVLGTTLVIVVFNATRRTARTLGFLAALAKGYLSVERAAPSTWPRRARHPNHIHIVDALLGQATTITFWTLFFGLLFVHSGRAVILWSFGIILATLLILRQHRLWHRVWHQFRGRPGSASARPLPDQRYDGTDRRVVWIVFAVRFFVIGFGLATVGLVDLTNVANGTAKTTTSIAELLATVGVPRWGPLAGAYIGFFALFVMQDLSLALTLPPVVAAAGVIVAIIGKLAVAGYVCSQIAVGLGPSTMVALACLGIDLRDGRAWWTHRPRAPVGEFTLQRHGLVRRHARRSAIITVVLVSLAVVGSVAIGFAVGTQSTSTTTATTFRNTTLGTGRFPLCTAMYGVDRTGTARLNLADLAALSAATYSSTRDDATTYLRGNPRLADVQVEHANLNDTTGVRFWEFRFPSTAPGLSVVAIRGTSTLEDVLEDARLWSTPLLLQGSSYFGTFFVLWPRTAMAAVVRVVAQYLAFSRFLYAVEVEAYTRALVQSGQKVLVTGHSLGGGLAQVVASRVQVPGVAISGPGLGMSYLAYDTTVEAIAKWTVNVVPFSDPVPMADDQVAAQVHLPCHQSVPSNCHSIKNTLQTIEDMCAGIGIDA